MKSTPAGSIGKKALMGGVGVWLIFWVGCAVSMKAPARTGMWHQQATGAYDTDAGKVFYGIGKAAPLQNRTLQRVNADNQARLEMARLLERYSNALARKSATAATPQASLGPSLKALVHKAMQRAMVTDHWADPGQGRFFSLCRLDLTDFEAVLTSHQELQSDLRAAMKANLEMVHRQLSQNLHEN